jgi:hypothetical protein
MKYCSKCEEEKSLDCFNKNQNWCRCCQKAYRQTDKGKASLAKYAQSDKGKASQAKYNKSDKGKASQAKFRISDKNKVIQKRYQQTDKGKVAFAKKQAIYKQTDKGKMKSRLNCAKRKARIKQNGVENFTYEDLRMFWLGQNILDDRCYYCRKSFSGKPEHIDHYIPIAKGGGHY